MCSQKGKMSPCLFLPAGNSAAGAEGTINRLTQKLFVSQCLAIFRLRSKSRALPVGISVQENCLKEFLL